MVHLDDLHRFQVAGTKLGRLEQQYRSQGEVRGDDRPGGIARDPLPDLAQIAFSEAGGAGHRGHPPPQRLVYVLLDGPRRGEINQYGGTAVLDQPGQVVGDGDTEGLNPGQQAGVFADPDQVGRAAQFQVGRLADGADNFTAHFSGRAAEQNPDPPHVKAPLFSISSRARA